MEEHYSRDGQFEKKGVLRVTSESRLGKRYIEDLVFLLEKWTKSRMGKLGSGNLRHFIKRRRSNSPYRYSKGSRLKVINLSR